MQKEQLLLDYIKENGKNKTWNELAEQFGYKTGDIVRCLVRRRLGKVQETVSNNEVNDEESTFYNLDKGELKFSHIWDHPPTPEEVIKHHRVDENKWRLSKVWMKMVPKGYLTSALFNEANREDKTIYKFTEFLKGFTANYKPVKKSDILINNSYSRPVCLLLSLCDFHIGKLDREIVDIEVRLEQYRNTINTLLYKAYLHHNIDEIVFVLGNDLLQVDTINGTTVKGTSVGQSITWDKSYEIAFKLMAESIDKIRRFCNKLTVVSIPGNHSESREYYISHALEIMFSSDSNITFNRSADKYKCITYGETAIFLNHGDNIQDKLPLMFAQTFREQWGKTKYHEIILGDRHHNSEKTFKHVQGEAQGVRMRILPSLTNIDQWHYDNLFTNSIQAGIALIYDKEYGKCSEFEHRI